MLLGTIIEELRDETHAASALAALGDLVLIAEVDRARVAHEETLGAYVTGAAQRFARLASDEDWLGLMNGLDRSETPAATCLTTMLRWAIARDAEEARHEAGHAGHACTCGGGGACHDHA